MRKLIKEALTFDDVMLIPAKSEVLYSKTHLATYLTKKVKLNAPIMSAGMDTVTEAQLAIAMARQGGIGIIHGNMSIDEQAIEVDRVKRSEHGVITDPFSLSPNHYVYEADELMARYHISGVPITENGKLVGIITNRDIRFETDHNKKVYEVMTRENLVTATEGTTLEQAKIILTSKKIEKLPIVDAKGRLKGLITIKDIQKSIKYPNAAKDEQGRLLVGASVGVSKDALERTQELIKAKVNVIVVEAMHGHCTQVIDIVKNIKANYDIDVIAGNVTVPEAVIELIEAGADAIKVGFGAASISTSRLVSGVGVPQITAILDCSEAASGYGIPIIADGGMKFSGDLTKAIAAGANVCMIGGIFAGCEESPGVAELFQGRKYKVYRGIQSVNGVEKDNKTVPEGVEGRISYKGSVAEMMEQLLGGLTLGMSYCGCTDIKELQEKSQFVKITGSGLKESHPHDIQITREASNYSIEC